MSVAKYIVNRSTTLIQIDSSQSQNAIVLLSSVNTIGSLVTIRDIAGSLYKGSNAASNNIVTISTMKDIYFIHKDLSDNNVSSILLTQPYGFITVSPKTSTLWAVVNTQAFPDATTAANLITLHASTSLLNEASISTCRISTLAANNISTMSLSAVSSIVQSNLYVPFINNSSLMTSSILTSSLTAGNIYVSSIQAISTIIHSNLYVPFIHNSSLMTSSVLTSSLTAGNIYVSSIQAISTIIQSNLYVPFIYNSSLQTSSIMASTIIASSITASTVATSTLSAFTTGISGSVEISGTNVASRIWVVVGQDSGTHILYSTDGLTWVPATYDSSVTGMISLNDVCWNGSNRWVAVGKGSTHTILYSEDGMVWKATNGSGFSLGSSGGGNGISYNSVQGKWVAVGKGTNAILYSTDGITWSSTSVTGTSGFLECKGVANNGSRWMAVGKGTTVSNHILTSTDGLSWTQLPNSGLGSINAVVADSYSDVIYAEEKAKWFVVGTTTNILNSIISIANDAYLTCAAISLGGFNGGGNSIAWNGCYFVAVGSDSNRAKTIQYSLDGSKWYPSFMALLTDPEPSKVGSFKEAGYSVVWAENYFIAVGSDSDRPSRKIIYSADGKNWLSYDVTGNENLVSANGICYSRGSTGPLYALTIKGDAYIDGNLYITNGYPVSVNAITGSSSGASGAGGSGAGGSGAASSAPAPLRYVTDVSTMLAQFSSIGVGVKDPAYEIDVAGSINASSNIYINGDKVTTENSLASTIEGLGSFKYISSLSLQSTVQSFMTNCSSLQANFSSIGVNCNSPQYHIDVIGDINYTGTLYHNGVTFTGSASIPGINSIGNVAINKIGLANAALDVDGSAFITGDSVFNNNLYIGGRLTVNSNINLGGITETNNAVTTLAGSGTATESLANPDGTGIESTFNYPRGLAIAPDGTIYVADEYNRRIRKITPGGVVTTLAGSGTQAYTDGIGTAASFKSPRGLSLGPDGNIYVADTESHVIRKVTPGGVVTTLAGGGTQSFADGTGTNALFNWPYDVSVARDGNIYVADTHNERIRKITPQGVVTSIAGQATSTASGANPDGTGAAASFNLPHALEVGPDGIIYVADTNNNRIRKVTTTGVVTTLAGQETAGTSDATGASASFNKPRGIEIDKDGNVYVGDTDNHRIRKITPGGTVTTFTGNTLGDSDGRIINATFNLPWSVAIGPDGNIYVADTGNNKIRKIDSGSTSLNMTGNAYFTNFINAGGNVNVNGELDVSGNANFRSGVNSYKTSIFSPDILIASPGSTSLYHKVLRFTVDSGATWIQSASDISGSSTAPLYFSGMYGGNIRMAIAADGKVGIGTTSPAYALDVVGSIYASVDVLAQSDIRVKTNIVEIDSPLEKIMNMRGVYYNRKDDSNATPARHVGVIAQEVEEVLPEVVSTDNSEAKHKSVAYGNIVALLIEAVKAQQSTIDSLLLSRQ